MREFQDPSTGEQIVWLGVDEHAITSQPSILKTVLGSCVGIALFDEESDYFGLNHFLNVDSGLPLTEKLVMEMRAKGAKKLKAIIMGGSNQASMTIKVGPHNISFAREILQSYSIPIIKENVGGQQGRTVTVHYKNRNIDIEVSHHNAERETVEHSDNKVYDAVKSAFDAMAEMSKKYNK